MLSNVCAWTGDDFESSLLSFEKLDRASPDLWPEQRKRNILLMFVQLI